MEVQGLRVLLEVERRGSFAGAADALHFTPSAVSQQIARLETEAGVRLVERDSRGAQLTDAGRALAVRARVVMGQLADARQELAEYAGGGRGRLRVCAFPTAASTFVAHALAAFHRAHPEVRLHLRTAQSWEALAALEAREADVALVVGLPGENLFADHRGLRHASREAVVVEPLMPDPFLLVLPEPGLPEPVDSTALAALALIGDGPAADAYLRDCAETGLDARRLALAFNDFHALQSLVAAGLGFGFVPALATMTGLPGVTYRRAPAIVPVRRVSLALPAAAAPSPAADALAGLLRALAAEAPEGWVSAERPFVRQTS